MLDYTYAVMEQVSVHHTGNKTNDEPLILSKTTLDISDDTVSDMMLRFFLLPFSNPEFYRFSFSSEDFTLNPMYQFATQIFQESTAPHLVSVNIAKYLYDLSEHPQIKAGDLFIARFSGIQLNNEQTDAIGIFKSENRQSFLKLNAAKDRFSVSCEDGINIDKLDKGCLIFNTTADEGYKICIIDKSNKSGEAQFWKDNFLQLAPCRDEYNLTREFMTIAKTYVTKQLAEEFEVSKADQIDLLNRSVEYFKSHDTFDKKEFEEEVFQDPGIIKSFRSFDKGYCEDHDIEQESSFEISPQAVKKQVRVFKSVLKLDKNFHIYIHGNRELIQQGVERDGRKYYKIYFDQEL